MPSTFSEIWSTTLFTMPGGYSLTVSQIVLILLMLLGGYLASRVSAYLLHRKLAGSKLRPDVIHALSRIVFWSILVAVVLVILGLLHIPLTAFAFITGGVAIGIGFGAQNIINNFISGWILMTERPIRIDDFIEIDGMLGVVERIGNRSTRIRRTDGVHLLVPNSMLLERTVVNWTLIDHAIRSTIRVGVAYGSPVRQVANLILQAVTVEAATKDSPKPIVVFDDFGDSALIFEAYFWCDVTSERELRQVRSDIRLRITDLFAEHGIVIAFPQQDVHLAAQSPVPVRVVAEEVGKV
jgi:small-conductance mechanosensitive channel